MSGEDSVEKWEPPTPIVPDYWETPDFIDLIENISTSGIKVPQKSYLQAGEFPVIDQGQKLIGGYTNDDTKVLCGLGQVIVFGDHTRCFKLINFDFSPGADGVKVLKPNNGINSKYIYYALKSLQLPNRGYSRHYSFLKKSKLPLAPLNEQKRIVDKIEELFSELDNGIESLKTARKQFDIYRKSILNQCETGEILLSKRGKAYSEEDRVKLKDIVKSIGQGWSPKCHNHPSKGKDTWGVIKTSAIQHLFFDQSENKELPDSLEPREHLEIKKGDILITRAGPRKRVGVACLVKDCREKLILCDKAYRIEPDTAKIIPEYLVMVLNTPKIIWKIEELKSGINDSGLNLTQKRFLDLEFYLPSLTEQKATLDILNEYLSKIENTENEIDAQLKKSEALRQSILKDAFAGKLVDQDPTDEPASVLLERIKAGKQSPSKTKKKKKVA